MNRWHFVTIASAVVVGVVGGGLYLHTRSQTTLTCAESVPKPTIMAFGDSLVEGYGAPKGSDFVAKLSNRLGVPISNMGKNGDTTALGLARAQTMPERPDVLILLIGGNDALQKVPQEETKKNLSRIIELFQSYQSKPIQVVLVGVLGGFPLDPYAQMFKDLAQQHHVIYVPNILSGLIGNQDYMSDQVHPNEAGYERIAERLEPVLNAACKEYGRK